MLEKDLYPAIENFLKTQKNCVSEYTGTELLLKKGGKPRVDVFGISDEGKKTIYLCEGKKDLRYRRSFSNAIGDAMDILRYGDYVYVFGSGNLDADDFEDQISKCKTFGIGILSVDASREEMVVHEILEAQRNEVEDLDKKEVSLRVFVRGVNTPIADIIFQAAYEYINREQTHCVSFIDVYDGYFTDENVKEMVRRVIGHHTLTDRDVRQEFQRRYGNSRYSRIERKADILDDSIGFTEEGLRKGKSPMLLT
jgi:hypothetical protein